MNQGKLEVVKQEMARVNVHILGISELKWTGMGEFNSDDHYIYYCGQESLRRNEVAIVVNKRVRNAVLGCNLKNDRMISVRSKSMPQPVMLKKLKLNDSMKTYKTYKGLECKSRKSGNIWSNSQIWPWNTERSRAKTNRVLPRKCSGHSKHPLPTTQEKTLHMDITRWSTPKSD